MNDKTSPKAATLRFKGRKTPIISALGENEVADELIKLAKEHNVPVYQDEDLVNVLTRLELGQAIPQELYEWVASALAFAFFIRNEVPDGFSPTQTRSAYQRVKDTYLKDSPLK